MTFKNLVRINITKLVKIHRGKARKLGEGYEHINKWRSSIDLCTGPGNEPPRKRILA